MRRLVMRAVASSLRLAPLVLALLAVPALAWADASVRLEVNARRLQVEDPLQITVKATGDYDGLTPPEAEGFELRHAGRQTEVRILNRQMQRIESHVFVGTASKPGRFRIGPAVLTAGGQEVARSNVVEIQVLGDDPAAIAAEPPEIATNLQRFAGEPFFVRPAITVPSPFAGQPFVLTYELYWTRTLRVHGIREVSAVRAPGFDTEDLLEKETPKQEDVQFAGHPYLRQITYQQLLTAARPGTLRVDGPWYRIEAGDLFETRATRVGAPPMAVTVRPVPQEGRPESYREGNVGRLQLSGQLAVPGTATTGAKVQAGQRVLLEYTVAGDGNLLGLAPVRPPEVPGMTVDALPARGDEGVRRTLAGTEGKRTWQWVLTFDRPGRQVVPAVTWSAFDPYEEQFTTSEAGPFEIEVTPAPGGSQDAAAALPGSTDAKPAPQVSAAKVLRPLAAQARLAETSTADWTRRPWFWGLAVLPWLGGLGLLGGAWLARRRARSAPLRRRAAALPQAVQQLRAATAAGPDGGYAAIRAAVAGYLEEAAGLHLAGLTEGALATRLRELGVDAAAAEQLVVELQHCDYARFAPGSDRASDLEQTVARVAEVLAHLETGLAARPRRQPAGSTAALVLACVAAAAAPDAAMASTLDDAFAAANQAHVAGDLATARAGYETLLTHRVRSPAVHYNLANTLVKLGALGPAVFHYRQALRLEPEPGLRADARHNLGAVRSELADRSRRRHATLHVFDESPELDVALARAVPTRLSGALALAGGFGALGLLVLAVRRRSRADRPALGAAGWSGLAVCAVLHVGGLLWLRHAHRVQDEVVFAVVVEEDATLAPCLGDGEIIGLPEGLEIRRVGELADGRVEVRLPNGRVGCVQPQALLVESR